MSLSRILNDELSTSSSPAQSYAGSSSVMLADPAPPRIAPEPASNAISSSRIPGMYPDHAEEPHQPPDYPYHPAANQEGWCTEPYTREWVRGNVSSLEPSDIPFHMETREMYHSSIYREIETEIASRKRRKGISDDADYQPPSQRRVSFLLHHIRSETELMSIFTSSILHANILIALNNISYYPQRRVPLSRTSSWRRVKGCQQRNFDLPPPI
jgi:hypothetical protein